MPDPIPPVFLATAVEAVIRAGDLQIARVGEAKRIEKKGLIAVREDYGGGRTVSVPGLDTAIVR